MHTSKGYLVPVIAILALLLLAGVFVFTQNVVESPTLTNEEVPVVATSTTSHTTPVATSTDPIDEDDDEVPTATTTASTSLDISVSSDESEE